MSVSGFTGLSYPFRISSQGGAVMSTANKDDSSHINESIQQILGTYELERPMESNIFSNLDTALFEPNNIGIQAILKNIIAEDLERLEDRISVNENDIEFTIEEVDGVEYIYAVINYTLIKYDTSSTAKIKLGEV